MVMIAGLTCGQAEDKDKKSKDRQESKLQGELAALLAGPASASAEGRSYRVWTVTIRLGAKANECTSDNPWQSLYTGATGGNDQIRFKSTGPAYTIHFTLDTPLNDMNGKPANDIPVLAAGFSALYVAQTVVCTSLDETTVPCAYPYNISFTDGNQCNNGGAPPDGSDGIVIKGGGG